MENTPTPTPTPTTTPTTKPPFRMRRSRTEKMLGGVCGGLAESLDVDVTLLRIAFVALTVLGGGIGIPLYVAAWIVAPEG
jgi:phage shock protein PspC (stress-responsive transcriptional regulator)